MLVARTLMQEMCMTTRRTFIQWVPAAGLAVTAAQARAQAASQAGSAGPMVDPQDPQAKALHYVTDATKVDKSQNPNYKPGQHCAVCQLYQGPASAQTAPCTIFGGKRVAAAGWCSAFVPKSS
jgi:hypothetical protein